MVAVQRARRGAGDAGGAGGDAALVSGKFCGASGGTGPDVPVDAGGVFAVYDGPAIDSDDHAVAAPPVAGEVNLSGFSGDCGVNRAAAAGKPAAKWGRFCAAGAGVTR